jgi:hypothetical protein
MMSKPVYIEDIFDQFYSLIVAQQLLITKQDLMAAHSLYDYCVDEEKSLTVNQANYLLKILSRYKNESFDLGLDYKSEILNPSWKKTFRTLDLSKKVFVEVDSQKKIWICLKFPFSLKETFDKEIKDERSNSENNRWNHEKKLRMVEAYKHNIMHINEFVNYHNFDIDNTFLDLVSSVEEIWQQQDSIVPYASIDQGNVTLVNATEDAVTNFQSRRTSVYEQDIFLAKTMGFVLKLEKSPITLTEVISTNTANQFWLKENSKFFELYKSVGGKAAVILDKNTKDLFGWLKRFVSDAEIAGCKNDIKICFRETVDDDSQINRWIKENQLGGKVDQGNLYIFLQKPPKWLFKNKIDVKIIGTNCYVPPLSDSITSTWIFHHPCLCYLGEVKPTVIRNFKIVNL